MNKIKEFFAKVPKKIIGIIIVLLPFSPPVLYFVANHLYPVGLGFFLWLFDGYDFGILGMLFLALFILFVCAFIFTLKKENWLKNTAQFLLMLFFILLGLANDFLNSYGYHYPPYMPSVMPSVMPVKEY